MTVYTKKYMYSTQFHKDIENDECQQAVRLSEYIAENIFCSRFLDFGCSTGLYLNEIKKVLPSIESMGFEFSKDAISAGLCSDIIHFDLTHPLLLEKKPKTLGLCLEVLEHIEDVNWKKVLENITNLCDIVIFSAALPGQGGTGHINCRDKIDWIRRFHSLGWIVDHDATMHLLEFIKSGSHQGWFYTNVVIFIKA